MQILEDNEAVITMTITSRIPAVRHVVRTHRVVLDWLVVLIDGDRSFLTRHVNSLDQIADFVNKGHFTAQQVARICGLAQVGPLCPSSQNVVMANRSSKEIVIIKPPKTEHVDNVSYECCHRVG